MKIVKYPARKTEMTFFLLPLAAFYYLYPVSVAERCAFVISHFYQ